MFLVEMKYIENCAKLKPFTEEGKHSTYTEEIKEKIITRLTLSSGKELAKIKAEKWFKDNFNNELISCVVLDNIT